MSQIAGMNPWLSMWSQPRSTIRALVHNKPAYGIYFLAAISALQSFFFYANWWSLGFSTSPYFLLLVGIILSPFLGIIWLYFTAFIFAFTGRWLKGSAPAAHLRTAVAWSRIPTTITLLMWLVLIFANPDSVFIQDSSSGPSSLFVNLISLILGIWALILLIQSIREVQHFSLGKAILNILIAWIISSILILLAFGLARYLYLS